MKLFSYFYDKVIKWSKHHHAPYILGVVSFVESSFFPIPPDVMLISMALARPAKAWRFALIATISSLLGGLLGYAIGMFLFKVVYPYFVMMGHESTFIQVKHWFSQWGFWVVFLAGFTPIPYKIFTISAGAVHMPILPFMIASLVGRGARFYLVCGILYFGGERFHDAIRRYIDIMGWSVLALCVLLYGLWQGGVFS